MRDVQWSIAATVSEEMLLVLQNQVLEAEDGVREAREENVWGIVGED